MATDTSLAERVDAMTWYHTFDLPGEVTTSALFDHRAIVKKLPIPDDLSGMRCVDLASADGFFAFEMARRGAAEVVSVDLPSTAEGDFQGAPSEEERRHGDGLTRANFELVREQTGLDVTRREVSLYDLSPEALGGTFDFAFMGNVLLHLRDPELALQRARSIVAGRFLSFEMITLPMTLVRPRTPTATLWDKDEARWWTPNVAGHRRLLQSAGFRILQTKWPIQQPFGTGQPPWPSSIPRRWRDILYWGWTRRVGAPTQAALCEPIR